MKNFLLVTDVPFWQQQKGNHQRIAAMIAYFANHFQMTIVFLGIEIPQLQDDRLTVIHVCGRSPSVDAVYRNADIAINPQRFGSGLKIKTIEAMGYGVPVLTTSVGAEGLEKATDQALLCTDDAADMQQQLRRLSDAELRSSLSQNALKFVAHRLTPEACLGLCVNSSKYISQ